MVVVRRARKRRMPGAALCPRPVGARYRALAAHDAFDGLVRARDERGAAGVARQRLVRQRVGLHDQRLRVGAAAVDDAAQHQPGDGRAVGILRHRHCHPVVVGAQAPCCRRCRPASRCSSPTSPGIALRGGDGDAAAAVGHVVPHEAARFRHVDRLDQEKARDVLHFAVSRCVGASWMSWMIALRGSSGSSSPKARPAIVSY